MPICVDFRCGGGASRQRVPQAGRGGSGDGHSHGALQETSAGDHRERLQQVTECLTFLVLCAGFG